MIDRLKDSLMGLFILVVVFIAVLLACTPAHGQDVHGERAEYRYEVAKVRQAMGYDRIPKDAEWRVLVISKELWWARLNVGRIWPYTVAGTCYTSSAEKITWCNQDWLRSVGADVVAPVLRHEYGHIVCSAKRNDLSEACADQYARSGTL